MQTVTVAIADRDSGRCERLEQLLKDGTGIKVMANVMNASGKAHSRKAAALNGACVEDIVLEVSRLRPRILFFNLDSFGSASLKMIEALNRECPDTFIVVLTDGLIDEEQILDALANGARGYLTHQADRCYFLKAVRVVDQGEIWVSRKMLGRIMDKVCTDISLLGRSSLDLAS
jgi:DNA-binding NarL/FixJ family response regulator